MKITMFNGSHKGHRGNTFIMVEEFLAGAREAGAETEQVILADKEINLCKACMNCWFETPGKCIIRDDMDELLPKVIETNILGLATPVYVDNVTGLMKNFLDRIIPVGDPHWEKDENGECRHKARFGEDNKMVMISNCGFPEQSHFQVLRLLARRMARNLHADLIAEIYRGGGGLLKSKNPEVRPFIEKYKKLLRKAGAETIKNQALSVETKAALEKPLVPMENLVDQYVARVNQMCDERLGSGRK